MEQQIALRENGAVVEDWRTPDEVAKTIGFVVATDSFMSGWGKAQGRSLFAVPFTNYDEAATVEGNMNRRDEMKRVRIVYGADYPQKVKLGPEDHLSIRAYKRGKTDRFFIAGGF